MSAALSPSRPLPTIVPLGDRALIVEFEARVDPDINRAARRLARRLLDSPLTGVIDVVPAFCSVAVFYRPERIDGQGPDAASPYQRLARQIEAMLADSGAGDLAEDRVVSIPVCYGGRFGPDLDEVAASCGLTPEQVIAIHGASPHIVYMLGFSPGFPYIGGLDARLSLPRRSTPRTRIPAGSVAIARDQSAVYSFETPGGWNLIGRTPLTLFDPLAEPACLLQPGDRIRFEAIDVDAYNEAGDANQRQAGRQLGRDAR